MKQIDLVYLWVDGDDPQWLCAKEKALSESGREWDRQAVAKGRFVQCDELRYSLRSVERYMPWVGNIFIVTADQKPAWLNVDHPKIHLVSHREIMEPEWLPTFNSSAIEMCIARIKGLSECFIFANDDMYLLRGVEPSFFYNDRGLPIARFSRHISSKKSLYLNKVCRCQRLVEERCGVLYLHTPHHNMDSYLRSDVEACLEAFAEEAAATRSHRFRTEEEFHRSAWLYWAMANGRAEERIVSHYGAARSRAEELICRLKGRYCVESREFGVHRGGLERRIRRYNPVLLCLNDTERTSDEQRREMKALLEKMFPEKSGFEL